MVLSSPRHNIFCYYFDFKTCTVQTDPEIHQSRNQLSFMLHKLLFLWCHLQNAMYPYKFASYLYGRKTLQPYVAATVGIRSDAVLSSTGALLLKTIMQNDCQ